MRELDEEVGLDVSRLIDARHFIEINTGGESPLADCCRFWLRLCLLTSSESSFPMRADCITA